MAIGHQAVYTEATFNRLRLYNGVMGFFHLAQAAAVFALSNTFTLPVTTSFISGMPGSIIETPLEVLANIRLGLLVALFLLISAVAHLTLVLPGVFGWYKRNLAKGINYARWYEYSISASVMIVIIAMLSGMYDIASLILIFSLNASMILFGLVMEIHNQTTAKTNWTAFICGCFAGIVPWIAIAIYFFGTVSATEGAVPTFVYFILGTLAVFFFSFAVNMVLQYKKVGPWRNYLFGESMYILLSLVAKSALAWQVFGGTLARG
jgi:hypothetical protein